jgi:AspT/YidE/YbjL antiporter-like protein
VEIHIYELLRGNGLLLLFIVIGLGCLIGNINIFGIPAGPTVGVLLAGLFFGHYGLSINKGVGSFGFALFIFSVGIQAGPSFFSAFREDGPKYIALAALVAISGFLLAWSISRALGFENGFDAGLLAGALISTPTLADAQDAVQSGLAAIPAGMIVVDVAAPNEVSFKPELDIPEFGGTAACPRVRSTRQGQCDHPIQRRNNGGLPAHRHCTGGDVEATECGWQPRCAGDSRRGGGANPTEFPQLMPAGAGHGLTRTR